MKTSTAHLCNSNEPPLNRGDINIFIYIQYLYIQPYDQHHINLTCKTCVFTVGCSLLISMRLALPLAK